MPVKTPAHIREQQINALPNITFVRWDGEYINANSKAIYRCTVDGFEWSARMSSLFSGHGCPQCAGKRRWSAPERAEQIDNLQNITFVRWDGGYSNRKSKAVCRCSIDGSEWSARVDHLLGGRGCPHCAKTGYNPQLEGTLYALRSECGTMVKIGISNNHKRRHADLKRDTPFRWNCIELLHGDGSLVASLEKAFHGMTEPVLFTESFHGHTEWRKWTPEVAGWFDTWREMT